LRESHVHDVAITRESPNDSAMMSDQSMTV